ncbi:hypothetical protein FACS1894187_09800 [Synergistales bacterium]|nr:hypothetical protein FACS1894187_09800 [Synergistales bacterium]
MRENRKYGSVRGSRQYLHSVSIDGRSVETVYSTEGMEKGELEVARNLLTNGISLDIVVKSTGLPMDQIQSMMN